MFIVFNSGCITNYVTCVSGCFGVVKAEGASLLTRGVPIIGSARISAADMLICAISVIGITYLRKPILYR